MRKNLTELTVRALKPLPDKQFKVWDTTTPGFGVIVNYRSKSWFVMYGKDRKFKALGSYPDLSLADARLEAKRHLLSPQAPRPTISCSEAFTRFLDENSALKAKRTHYEEARLVKRYIIPKIGKKRLAELTDQDIASCFEEIEAPSEKLHAFKCARTAFRWFTRPPHRLIPHSPLEGFRAPSKDTKRSRILTDDELKALWNTGEGQFGAMIKLLILWGLRKNELGTLKWSYFEKDTFTIPHTKNGHPLTLPILPVARSILDTIPRTSVYLFPARNGKHLHDGSWAKFKLRGCPA